MDAEGAVWYGDVPNKRCVRVREGGEVLQTIDLDRGLPWSRNLANGAALRYRERVGFRYYEDEDLGIFWSNDPALPIGRMAQSIGVTELETELLRIQRLFHRAGVPGPRSASSAETPSTVKPFAPA